MYLTKSRWQLASATALAALSCTLTLAPAALAHSPAKTAGGAITAAGQARTSDPQVTAHGALHTPNRAIPPGSPVTYTLTAKNNGPSVAKNVKVTDTLPDGIVFVSAEGCTAEGQKITCTVDKLNVGETKVFTIQAKIDPAYEGKAEALKNTATIASDTADPKKDNDSSTADIPGGTLDPASADLSTTKEALGTTKPVPGETFQYKITTKNAGPSAATNVKVTDKLPAPLAFVSGDECTVENGTVTCTAGTLAPGAEKSWTITVKLDPAYTGDGKDLKNTATSTSDTPDPNEDNGTTPETDPPGGGVDKPSADLSTTKEALGTGPVAPGETFQYKITTKNVGPSTAVNVVAADELPKAIQFVSSDDGCTAAGQKVTCTAPTLAPDTEKSWTFTVRLDPAYEGKGDDLGNTATSTSDTPDPNDDNSKTDPVNPPTDPNQPDKPVAEPKADLEITKTATNTTPQNPSTEPGTETGTESGETPSEEPGTESGEEPGEEDVPSLDGEERDAKPAAPVAP